MSLGNKLRSLLRMRPAEPSTPTLTVPVYRAV